MGLFDKLFGKKSDVDEITVTEEMADAAAGVACTCTPEKKCAACIAREAGEDKTCDCTHDEQCAACAAKEATNSDMDENNLD